MRGRAAEPSRDLRGGAQEAETLPLNQRGYRLTEQEILDAQAEKNDPNQRAGYRLKELEILDAQTPSKKRRWCLGCCVLLVVLAGLWIGVVLLALSDLKDGCKVDFQVRALRGVCEGSTFAEAELDVVVECIGTLGSADITIEPAASHVTMEISSPEGGQAATATIFSRSPGGWEPVHLSSDGVASASIRVVLDTASPQEERQLAHMIDAYGKKRPFSIVVTVGEDSGAFRAAVSYGGIRILPDTAFSMDSDYVHDFTFTDQQPGSDQQPGMQLAVGLGSLSLVQNDAQEFHLAAEFDIELSALPMPFPTLQLPPVPLEVRQGAVGASEPTAALLELQAVTITEADLTADRLSLRHLQAATLKVHADGVPTSASLVHSALMGMAGAESAGDQIWVLTGAPGGTCSFHRLISHVSASIDLSETDGSVGDSASTDLSETDGSVGEFAVALGSVRLDTSANHAKAVVALSQATGRSLSAAVGAGWPELSLVGWAEGQPGFSLNIAVAPAADGGRGGEVDVSVSHGSLSTAVTRWWADLFGLHTQGLQWRLACPGAEATVLGQLVASVRITEVVEAHEVAAARAGSGSQQRSEEAEQSSQAQDELSQIMGHFMHLTVARSTPSELEVDASYKLVLPQSLSRLVADMTVDETVYRETTVGVRVVDEDSNGAQLGTAPVLSGRLVHATNHSLGLEIVAQNPSALGRMVERLAERRATDLVLQISVDDGLDSDGAFDTGDIALHIPSGWHFNRGEGSRLAVPCDDNDSPDEDSAEGSILGPITTEFDWHTTSVDVSFTSSVYNPLPIPVALSAFHFEIFHDDGDDELLATATLTEPLTLPVLGSDDFTVETNVPYSLDMLSAGLDLFVGDLVLGGRDGLIEFTLGGSFVVPVPVRHQNLVVSTCGAAAGVATGQYFAPGFCARDTGETCSILACPVELGATDCTTTAVGVQDRCDCAEGFCLTSTEARYSKFSVACAHSSSHTNLTPCIWNGQSADAPSSALRPVCARQIESIQRLYDGTTPSGQWGPEVCEDIGEEFEVCGDICAMQLSQSGSVSDGVRVTTRCVATSTGDCDCTFGFCSTSQACRCERCTEEWVPEGSGGR